MGSSNLIKKTVNSNKILHYNEEDFERDVKVLHEMIKNDRFDSILAIARGGVKLGKKLAHLLSLPFHSIRIQSYHNRSQHDLKLLHEPNWALLRDGRILVVDDLIDNGKTIEFLKEILLKNHISNYAIVVLIDKKKNSKIQPDYYIHEYSAWIQFFWEND